jgi:hypothetical protein
MKKKTQEWSVIGTNEHDFKNLHRSISPANDVTNILFIFLIDYFILFRYESMI